MKLAHIAPNWGKYGISGYCVFVVGLESIFTRTMKEAVAWCKKNGFSYIKL